MLYKANVDKFRMCYSINGKQVVLKSPSKWQVSFSLCVVFRSDI